MTFSLGSWLADWIMRMDDHADPPASKLTL
jgi:hypothetical protein